MVEIYAFKYGKAGNAVSDGFCGFNDKIKLIEIIDCYLEIVSPYGLKLLA